MSKFHAWVVQVEAVVKEQPPVIRETTSNVQKTQLGCVKVELVSPGLSFFNISSNIGT